MLNPRQNGFDLRAERRAETGPGAGGTIAYSQSSDA
jgi:hypothetical protein